MRLPAVFLALLSACATRAVRKETIVAGPVVLPLKMCPHTGMEASLGDEGERMLCERQIPVGSHLPLCVCRDEGFSALQTEETQNLLRKLQMEPTTLK